MATNKNKDIEFFRPENKRNLPFSEAVRVGKVLYLSGQVGMGAEGKVVPGGIAAETRQTMENIRATLAGYGLTMDRVVKVTIMLVDMNDFAAMNKEYVTFFGENLPARSTFGVSGLAVGAQIEIECIAVME